MQSTHCANQCHTLAENLTPSNETETRNFYYLIKADRGTTGISNGPDHPFAILVPTSAAPRHRGNTNEFIIIQLLEYTLQHDSMGGGEQTGRAVEKKMMD